MPELNEGARRRKVEAEGERPDAVGLLMLLM